MSDLSVRPVMPSEQRYFHQYLLPQTAVEIRRSSASHTILGALSGTLACGAAAVRWDAGEAVLASLFIDPLVRRRGLGGALAGLAVRLAQDRGAGCLRCDYVLSGEELTAMNALFARLGGAVQYCGPAYCADMSAYHETRFIGAALRSGYRPSRFVVPFSQLTSEQLVQLRARTDIPDYLRWDACAERCDPELSLAWVQEERVTAYILGGENVDGGYLLVAAWRSAEAPGCSFPALLRGQLNRCWYQSGGGFLYYFSAVTPPAQTLARKLIQGNCREYDQMSAVIPLL